MYKAKFSHLLKVFSTFLLTRGYLVSESALQYLSPAQKALGTSFPSEKGKKCKSSLKLAL